MRRQPTLALVFFALSAVAAPTAFPAGLKVISAAPKGALQGTEIERIQIVFSTAVTPLAAAEPVESPPDWLTIEPPLRARWRWAGTAELVGEPTTPLPRATTWRLRISEQLKGMGGEALEAGFEFTFSTPAPEAVVAGECGEYCEPDPPSLFRRMSQTDWGRRTERFNADSPAVIYWNQPIDADSLARRLTVTIAPHPLPGAESILPADQVERLRREDPRAYEAWRAFLAESRGPAAGPARFVLEPDPKFPREIFRIRPEGRWPAAAELSVEVAPGVGSLEGPDPMPRRARADFTISPPPTPLRFSGRTAIPGGFFDPEALELQFSSPIAWKDLHGFLTWREVGETRWSRAAADEQLWYWDRPRESARLEGLRLDGGKVYEVCVSAGARDASGRAMEYPWCGRVRTAHATPRLHLVERDGLVEWEGPHLLPLKSRNVLAFRTRHRRVEEEELAGLLGRRRANWWSEEAPETLSGSDAVEVPIEAPPDRAAISPVDLDPILAGRPGIILSTVEATSVLPASEYDAREVEELRRPRGTITQVTSLGLTVKSSNHEGILVWVTRLASGAPEPAAEVTVRGEGGGILWRGVTDERGLARTETGPGLGKAFLVTARAGQDLAYALVHWSEGHRGWEFNLPVDWQDAPPVIGLVWADRGIVRPGESVHVKSVVRRRQDRRLHRIDDPDAVIVVRDAAGKVVAAHRVTLDAWGAAETRLVIPETAATGLWGVTVGETYEETSGQVTGWQVYGSFRVAEFRRPKFRVEVKPAADRVVAGDPLHAEIVASLLSGGGMAGAPARWSVRAGRAWTRPAGARWTGWDFLPGDFDEEDTGDSGPEREQVVAQGDAALDEEGRLEVRIPRIEAMKGWPAGLRIEAEIQDVDRQTSASTAAVEVLPGEFFLGVKRPAYFVEAAKGVDGEVAAVAAGGDVVPDVPVTVTLVRLHWESVRRREVSGRYVFESRVVKTTVEERQVVTAGAGVPVHFDLDEGGLCALVVTGTDPRGNRLEASTWFYVFGDSFTPWRLDQENRIDLVPERGSYAPEETARVMVKSPWAESTALVTVERAGVLEARIERLTGTMPLIDIPILAEHTPNIFVSVVLLRGRVEAPPDPELIDPGRPAYRVGYCELAVPPDDRKLDVALSIGRAEYRPGQSARVEVKVTGRDELPRQASITLWAVDAGVLGLTGYRTPDLMAAFYERRGLGVTTAETRSRLVGRRSYGTKADRGGGGGGRESGGTDVRRDFRALAVWRGDVVTGEDGRAVVDFELPDSLTTYRLMAVAVAGVEEFGRADVEIRVTKPIGMEPALPRFLRPEDRATAGVVLRNRTKTAREVEVRLETTKGSPVRVEGGAGQVVTVEPGGSKEIRFELTGASPGIGTLRFEAATRGGSGVAEKDTLQVELPVVAMTPAESVSTFFSSSGTTREYVTVPGDVFASAGGLHVRLARTALVEAGDGVRWLGVYPHGCVEQNASRLLGVLAARRIGEGVALDTVDGIPEPRWIDVMVSAIAAAQKPDGGFGWWPGSGASDPVLSAHAAWALAEARRSGAAIDATVMGPASRFLSAQMRRDEWPRGERDGWTARVLVSFALARLGAPEPGYFQWLFDTRDQGRPVWGRALLAATLFAVDPVDPRAAVLLDDVKNHLAVEARSAHLEEPEPDWGWWVWWSPGRSGAAALLAVLPAGAGGAPDPIGERLARGLLDRIARDRFHTTHDTAWMLQALAAYRELREAEPGQRTATLTLGRRRLIRGSLGSTAMRERDAVVPMADLVKQTERLPDRRLPLTLEVEGGGTVHASATLSYAPRSETRAAVSNGLGLDRRFVDPKGAVLTAAAAGEELFLLVEVAAPSLRRFVAVEIPLPAGIEAVDPELATASGAARRAAQEEEAEPDEPSWWYPRPGFDHIELRDDRVMLYASELPPGRHQKRLLLRATTAGEFHVAPAHAEEMYAPELFATTPAGTFKVRDAPADR